jgi:8-oxo-dGTP pyrophosphatase MutT (NUDIX family)
MMPVTDLPDHTEPYIEREAARVVLLDPEGRVLLQEFRVDAGGSLWITPGGGLSPGETHEAAAIRELQEEVGHTTELGPWIWSRVNEFSFRGSRYRQRERFFLARTAPFEPDHSGWEPEEVEIVIGHRWWSVAEIEDAGAPAFAPRRLAELLRPLIAGIVPPQPVDAGV